MALGPRTRLAPEQRRAQILQEALKLIGEQGYNGFTIQALGQRCGLSNAGLLHYFGSKDAFLLGVLVEIGNREADVVAPLVGARDTPPTRALFVQVLRAIVDSAAAKPEVSRFTVLLMAESIATTHPAHGWFRQRQDEARELLTRLASGWTPDPRSTAIQAQAVLYGLLLQWLHGPPNFNVSEEWDKAISAILGAHTATSRPLMPDATRIGSS